MSIGFWALIEFLSARQNYSTFEASVKLPQNLASNPPWHKYILFRWSAQQTKMQKKKDAKERKSEKLMEGTTTFFL